VSSTLTINGKTWSPGEDFRQGIRKGSLGDDLIVWIALDARQPVKIALADSSRTMNWWQALEWAEDLDCGGYVDWRLAIVKQENSGYEDRRQRLGNLIVFYHDDSRH
jgi:hypothetical protein